MMYREENMKIALWRIYAEIKSILRYIRYQPFITRGCTGENGRYQTIMGNV